MGRNWKAGGTAFWKLADRIGIVDTLTQGFGIKGVFGLIGGAMMAAWSYLAGMPGPVNGTLALIAFVGILWGWNALTWRSQKGKGGKPVSLAADIAGKTDEEAILLGSWTVHKNTTCEPTYLAVWEFAADHRVSAKTQGYEAGGSWQFEPTRVLIDWDRPLNNGDPCYDTFHRPIIASGVRGDSWGGRRELNKVRRSKITAAT